MLSHHTKRRRLAAPQTLDVHGHDVCVPGVRTIRHAGNVRRGDDVRQSEQWIVGRNWLTPEDVESGATQMPADERPLESRLIDEWSPRHVDDAGASRERGERPRIHQTTSRCAQRNTDDEDVADAECLIPIRERMNLRLNADFFNVFNHPGNPNNVGSDGMESTRSSGNSPRTLQLSLRLTF